MKQYLFTVSSGPKELVLFVIIAGGSSNGRTAAFEAVNFGSIPSPPAMIRNHQ